MTPEEKEARLSTAIGGRLAQAMDAAGMSVSELAELSGFSHREIEDFVDGGRTYYGGDILVFCKILKTSPDWLMGWPAQR
jgi:hypothetical protein